MAKMTPSQWRQYASQWQRAGKALDGVRLEERAAWQYDASTVNALLDIGAKAPRKEEEPNGLVEMQKWFMKLARKQGLLPAVREESAGYGNGTGMPSHPAPIHESRHLVSRPRPDQDHSPRIPHRR